MPTKSQVVFNAKAELVTTGLSTLAAGTYIVTPNKDNSVNMPDDLIVEIAATVGTAPTGLQQVSVFAQASYDGGTSWQSGPTSGTTTTDEGSLTMIGTMPIKSTSVLQRKSFSVSGAYGFVPPLIRFVIKNETGVALTTGTVFTIEAILQSS